MTELHEALVDLSRLSKELREAKTEEELSRITNELEEASRFALATYLGNQVAMTAVQGLEALKKRFPKRHIKISVDVGYYPANDSIIASLENYVAGEEPAFVQGVTVKDSVDRRVRLAESREAEGKIEKAESTIQEVEQCLSVLS